MCLSHSKVASVVGVSKEGKKWRLGWSRNGVRTQESEEEGGREDGLKPEQKLVRNTLMLGLLNP